MLADELTAVLIRLERMERLQRTFADIVRRALYQIVRVIEREFDLPPLGEKPPVNVG